MRAYSVVLINPRFPHNVGNALRGCAVFNFEDEAPELVWTGTRFSLDKEKKLPREERIRAYNGVQWRNEIFPIQDFVNNGFTPVCMEVRKNSEPLTLFEHPDKAVYVFGPEDGSVPKGFLHVCHRFVHIPARGCLNLAAAVNVVLYDRLLKHHLANPEQVLPLADIFTMNKDERMGLPMCMVED